jgi:hypothetical protein
MDPGLMSINSMNCRAYAFGVGWGFENDSPAGVRGAFIEETPKESGMGDAGSICEDI